MRRLSGRPVERVELGFVAQLRRSACDGGVTSRIPHSPIISSGRRFAIAYKLCGSTSTTAVSPARRIAGAAAESRCAACDAIRRGCVVFADELRAMLAAEP